MGNCWSTKQTLSIKEPISYVAPLPTPPSYRWSKISEVSQETDIEPLSI